jgi:hypothetical protein
VTRRHEAVLAGLSALLLGAACAAAEPRPKDERDQVTRYHAYHVLVPTQAQAVTARARIVAAARGAKDRTIEALRQTARELSADADSASRGGDLGRVLEGTFSERFERAVLALEPGTLSAPFASEFGWHVVYLAEKRAIPVSLVCGPPQALESGDVARITVELGPSWRGPAADRSGTVTFLLAESSDRGAAFRHVTLHRELPHAVLVPARDPPACYRSMRTRFVADCGRERLAGRGEDYFEARAARGTVVDAIEDDPTLEDADFDPVPAHGGARQVYDAVCQSDPGAW